MNELITCEWCAEEIPAGSTRCPKCQGSVRPPGRRIQGTPLASAAPAPAKPKAPAGWYDDPKLVNTRRYWDGQSWTEHRQEKVTTQPPAAEPVEQGYVVAPILDQPKDRRIGCGGVVLALIILVVVLAAAGVFSGSGDTSGGDKIEAQIMCKDWVKDRLKAPATADFANLETTEGTGDFTVDGDVDSENSFGAKLRNHFACTVHYTASDKTWHLDGIDMTNR